MPAGRSPELRLALRLTEERLGGEVRFEDLADEVGLAPRSLARRFSEETGMTWRAALRRMRVLRAIEELAAGDTQVTKIAYMVGYSSLSAFNAAFQELTGRTPTEYHVITCYTFLRVKMSSLGVIVVGNQNITLSLPEEDLREARILAASRGTSVSQLLARMLRELVEQETGYARARDRSLARLREGTDLGTGGHIGWSRDSVHER